MNNERVDKQAFGGYILNPMQLVMKDNSSKESNIVLYSPTGSGKTLAYILSIIKDVNVEEAGSQVVVILPTRELAIQSCDVFKEIVKVEKLAVTSIALHGGRPAMEENRQMKAVCPQVIFATPGRLNDHLEKGNIAVTQVKDVIIDEFDKCLELGFMDEISKCLSFFDVHCRKILTSATVLTPKLDIEAFFGISFKEIDFLDNTEVNERTQLLGIHIPEKDKLSSLPYLLTDIIQTFKENSRIIVFANFRESVERIGKYLEDLHFAVNTYHGGLEQDIRERHLYKFRAGAINVLVATDIAARGLDIPEVNAVVHYHMPLNKEVFIHRSGRTARWDKQGNVYLLKGPQEQYSDFLEDIKYTPIQSKQVRPIKPQYTALYIGRGKNAKLSKGDIVGFLCKKGGLKSEEIGRIDINPYTSYVVLPSNKVKTVLKLVAGEKIKGVKTIIEEMRD